MQTYRSSFDALLDKLTDPHDRKKAEQNRTQLEDYLHRLSKVITVVGSNKQDIAPLAEVALCDVDLPDDIAWPDTRDTRVQIHELRRSMDHLVRSSELYLGKFSRPDWA